MADKKVSALAETTIVANGDLIYLIDDPDGTPLSRKASILNAMRIGYGMVHRTDAATGFALTGGVWTNTDAPNTNGGTAVGIVENGASGFLTPAAIGVYLCVVTLSVFAPGGTTLRFRVTSDTVAQAGEASITLEGSGDRKTVTLHTLVNQLGTNDILRLQTKADASVTVQFQDAVILAQRVG